MRSASTVADRFAELRDLVVDLPALLHQGADLLDRVDHGGVVAVAELAGDGRVAEVGELAEDVHAHLPGGHERPAAALTGDLVDAEGELLGGPLQDERRGDGPGL